MLRLFTLWFWVFLAFVSIAQTPTLLPAVENGKWGFINTQGSFVIDAQYERCMPFEDRDYTWVSYKGSSYLIARNGTVLSKTEVSDVVKIQGSYLICMKDNLYAVFNKDGRNIIPYEYPLLTYRPEIDHFIVGDKDQLGLLGSNGEIIIEHQYTAIEENRGYYVASDTMFKFLYSLAGELLFNSPLKTVRVETKHVIVQDSNDILSILDPKGTVLYQMDCDAIDKVHEDHFALYKDSTAYLLDAKQAQIVDSSYERYIWFNERSISVRNSEGLYGLWDVSQNKLAVEDIHEDLATFPGADLIQYANNGLYGLMSTNYKVTMEPLMNQIGPWVTGGFILARNGADHGLIDSSGKLVLSARFNYMNVDGITIKAKTNEAVHLYEIGSGQRLLDSIKFTNVQTVGLSGRTTVDMESWSRNVIQRQLPSSNWRRVKSKWGLLNNNGNTVIKPVFDDIIKISGTAYVLGVKTAGRSVMSSTRFSVRATKSYSLVNEETYKVLGIPFSNYIDTAALRDSTLDVVRCMSPQAKFYLIRKSTGKHIGTNSPYISPYSEGIARMFIGSRAVISRKNNNYTLTKVAFINDYCNELDLALNIKGRRPNRTDVTVDARGFWVFIDYKGNFLLPKRIFKELELEDPEDFKHGTCIVRTKGKYGVLNKRIEFIIPAKHSRIERLEGSNDSLFKVMTNETLYGYISDEGVSIHSPTLNRANSFQNNLAWSRQGNDFLLVNTKGDVIDRFPDATKVIPFSEGIGAVKQGRRFTIIDSNGNALSPTSYIRVLPMTEGLMGVKLKGKYGYINSNGFMEITPQFNSARPFANGLAIVRRAMPNNNGISAVFKPYKYGAIDRQGNFVLRPVYDKVSDFDKNGLAVVEKGRHKGVAKADGKLLLKVKFTKVFIGTTTIVVTNGKRTIFYDHEGNRIAKIKGEVISGFSDGYVVVRKGYQYGVMSARGLWVLQPKYRKLCPVSDGITAYQLKGYVQVIDINGNDLSKTQGRLVGQFRDGWLLVKNGRRFNYFSPRGQMGFNRTFDRASPYKNGQAIVKYRGQYGVIDKQGYFIIAPRYSMIYPRTNGIYRVQQNTHTGVCILNGNFLIAPRCDDIQLLENEQVFSYSYNNQIGYFTKSGVLIYSIKDLEL